MSSFSRVPLGPFYISFISDVSRPFANSRGPPQFQSRCSSQYATPAEADICEIIVLDYLAFSRQAAATSIPLYIAPRYSIGLSNLLWIVLHAELRAVRGDIRCSPLQPRHLQPWPLRSSSSVKEEWFGGQRSRKMGDSRRCRCRRGV